ncbi:acetoacetate-CoA ligase [Rhinocladiella mackenziei CBS 650.93]|uniref:Acetoacetate-CoA ligase n=1 Tax=Rhinocladiella mackenziei CBS 650.93 TaxID=1442369 RepID=A0A0D2IG15_9EURO|nr:acetoacetate-CoA ligase [Rhinocladiella mackenziei CBS 650.93]KIX04744.1 acetoacetate-CoA ligase [Rhinocladiella mackenziei CBS 650.93]
MTAISTNSSACSELRGKTHTFLPKPAWQPQESEGKIPMNVYREHINKKFNLRLSNSHELHTWSVTDPQAFWIDLWTYVGLIPALPPGLDRAYNPQVPISEIPPFFENVTLNYAENVLTQPLVDGQSTALIGLREGQNLDGEKWTWSTLCENVRKVRSALLRSGIQQGDRVAALVSTSVWSVALFLGAASIGAIFTSIAADLGLDGCISRLQQVRPSILFVDSHCVYKGRQSSNQDKISHLLVVLKPAPEIFLIPTGSSEVSQPSLEQFLKRSRCSDALEYVRLPFTTPLYILYSSGTSGPPKCLVHSHGVIIQHKKIGMLHNSLKPGEIVFQYSSTSWVLWNIMIGHLSMGTTLILYDGSPTWPQPQRMLEIVERHKVAYWGTSPKYLKELESTGCKPKTEFNLSRLRMVQTGGSHLAADQYHWFYQVFPPCVHLTSVTGGTDLVTSWCGTDPAGPLYPGEIQMPILGHDVDIVDPASGASLKSTGTAGEFVCRKPFPSMPVFMWGDSNKEKYRSSYFDLPFPVWAQHDFASVNPVTRGWVVHGRSDGVLNPQGIRYGSAEIYSITEAAPFSSFISSTLCVGRKRKDIDSDESVFLFVVMRDGNRFTTALSQQLKDTIRQRLSARHVPRFVVEVTQIPMTSNGKKVETLVRDVISTGQMPKKISSTIVNPECLEKFQHYYGLEPESQARL